LKKIILLAALLLSACSSEEEVTKKSEPADETNVEQKVNNEDLSQEEINEKLKEEATRADFVELDVDNPPIGKKVFIDGKVSVLTEGTIDSFTLTSEEGTAYGMYKVILINTTNEEYTSGDQVRVFGSVKGKDEIGMPEISATILEKNK